MYLVSGLQFSPLTATRKIVQKPAGEAWLLGGTAALAVSFLVWFSQRWLADDGVRAGAARLGMGLALGAGAGAFLLPQMIGGKRWFAGATFTLPATLLAGLVGVGAMILAELPWYSLLMFALVPLAARLPGPEQARVWLQAILFSVYSFAVAALACVLAWPEAQQT